MSYEPPYVCECGARISRDTSDRRVSNFRWRVFKHEQTKRHVDRIAKLRAAAAVPATPE